MERRSHSLTEANWSAIDNLAETLGCQSWRVMLRRIAVGELRVVDAQRQDAEPQSPVEPEPAVRAPVVPRTRPAYLDTAPPLPPGVPRSGLFNRESAQPIPGGLVKGAKP